MSTFKAILVLLTVKRGTHDLPIECAEHEVPILRALHPDGDIKFLDKEHGVIELEASAEAEYARLIRKYDNKHDKVVRLVYPTIDVLANQLGIPYTFDHLAADPLQPQASEQNDPKAKDRKASARELRAAKNTKETPLGGPRRGSAERSQGAG